MKVKSTATTIKGTLNLRHKTLVGQPELQLQRRRNGMFIYEGDLYIDLDTITALDVRLNTLSFLMKDDEPSLSIITSQCQRTIRHTSL